MPLSGIMPALITAYDDSGRLDLERNGRLVDALIGAGVDGLFISGSTGEALLHTLDERRTLMTACVEAVDRRVSVIAHVGQIDVATTLDLTRFAVEQGVDAVAAVTPIYYYLDASAHADYYRRIADALGGATPLIAYHIPSRTGVELGPDFFLELANEGVIQGLKYTSTDLYPLAEVRRSAPEGFLVYNGADEVITGGLALGADGGIGSTYNAVPRLYLDLRAAVLAGNLAEARRLQALANTFIGEMFGYNFISFLRAALERQGIAMGASRAPLPGLDAAQHARVRTFFDDNPEISEYLITP